MAWPTIILVFVISWWMIFFTMLPVGVRGQHESDEEMVEGTEPGAPVKPNLLKKAGITTVLAIAFTIGFYLLEGSGVIDFRAMSGRP